jgi:hypothetical protein
VGLYLELIPPTVPEVRRVIVAMASPKQEREFRLGWSLWRRAHQAVAKRSHAATRKAKRELLQERAPDLASPASPTTTTKSLSAPVVTFLTDEKWESVRSVANALAEAAHRTA